MNDPVFTTVDKIRESNRIEGIFREPTAAEIAEFERFMTLPEITVKAMERFVKVYQPSAELRAYPGMNVRVGDHFPPEGGHWVVDELTQILRDAFEWKHRITTISPLTTTPWHIHLRYEILHPFMDGNGRSGRMLWYWQMGNAHVAELGFLHCFYYQTLRNQQVRNEP